MTFISLIIYKDKKRISKRCVKVAAEINGGDYLFVKYSKKTYLVKKHFWFIKTEEPCLWNI